jgi:hypothetical protein
MCFSPLDFAHTHTYTQIHSYMITHISAISRHTMNELIFYQVTFFNDSLKTLISYLHTQHHAYVDENSNCSADCLTTHFTGIMALTTMYAFMVNQTTLVTVCLITHITQIRALVTMHALMSYQTALCTECLITHITNIRALTTMHTYMCYQSALITECPVTLLRCKGAHHYACVDV